MSSRADYLAVLGLGPEASQDEATAAYKDLVRVWHPDRFQSDERLRGRAEEETKKINDAISRLKQLPAEPRGTKRSHRARNRAEPQPQRATPHPAPDSFSFSGASSPRGFSHLRMGLAPLVVLPKRSSSAMKVSVALGALWLVFEALRSQAATPLQSGAAITAAFAATNVLLLNGALLIFPAEVLRVDEGGLFLFRLGRLVWSDVQRMWASRSGGGTYLAITFSRNYLQRQNPAVRLFYWVRRQVTQRHTALPLAGSNSDAVQVVDAINLRHHSGCVVDLSHLACPAPKLFWMNLTSLLCPMMVVIRCLTQETVEAVDYLPYAAIFLLCRIYCISRLVRHSRGAKL